MTGFGVPTSMKDLKVITRVAVVVIIALWIGLAGLYDLLRPISNGCIMTYMYPTYIPISTPKNVTSSKYGLYLYHEGWRKIDFDEHLKNLNGVPVLFIPGNGGSYKQVRSLGAESDRAYQGGPLEWSSYQASPSLSEGEDIDLAYILLPYQYTSMLDWFAVDLEGEHSAMDGRILQEHTEYVVYAIHRILDQYKESRVARAIEGASVSSSLPKSVILVGHSMGGFVARAAVVHPNLKKSAVETVLTLSSPHQSPPVALQPSLGNYYAHVNQEWRKGYHVLTSRDGNYVSGPLSHVVVVSVSGGYNDYQVRSRLESLDGIVPPTHGFMISSSTMKNVWLSMEHQVILWCNQLVVQVSHTLLSLVDSKTGQPFEDVRHRLGVFMKMLQSGIPKNFISSRQLPVGAKSSHFDNQDGKVNSGSEVLGVSSCPSNTHWSEDGLQRDLYIKTNTVSVLAMDGRRRWLDIQKVGSDGKSHFVFVTNLSPCSGVRLHLWRQKGNASLELSSSKRVIEVTFKMVPIPSRPAPKQIEPGSQTEQASPSAIFWLGPSDMHGFRFLTISVAPAPTVSGRPPPAASMGVGQFFNAEDGEEVFSPYQLIHSLYSQEDMNLQEDHPLILNLTFSVSLGLLPISLSLRTTGCGIKKSEFSIEEPGEVDRLCRLRCFPPVALAWDPTSGLHVFPSLYSQTIIVDSSPALWASSQDSDKTTLLLLVDPHCAYKISFAVSVSASARRFLLLYFSQISGLSVVVVFFALMRQAYAWELDQPIPSLLSAVDSNLRMPRPFFFLATLPILFAMLFSCLSSKSLPPIISFPFVSVISYVLANGAIVVLISLSQLFFYAAGTAHLFMKNRWQFLEGNCVISRFGSIKMVRIIRGNPLLITALIAIALVCFVHPALGLFVLVLSHALCCYSSMSSFLIASFRSHVGNKEFSKSGNDGERSKLIPVNETSTSSPQSPGSYGDSQLEIFHHRHGLLVLHLLATLMFVPSLVAWFQGIFLYLIKSSPISLFIGDLQISLLQRAGFGQSFPWLIDSVLCVCVILHGICDSKPEFNFFLLPIPGIPSWEFRLSFGYLIAGYFSYLSALAMEPYRVFYAMATIGIISFSFRIIQRMKRKRGETYHRSRKHSHRH